MRNAAVFLALIALLALAPVAGTAQTASPNPSATPLHEVSSVTVAAKEFYSRLVSGNIDRSHLGAQLNNALTPTLVSTTSQRLVLLGNPLWQYVGGVSTASGPVYVYSLRYENGIVLYYNFGMDASGTIFAVFIGTNRPPGV
jgi:hypothetical protein